MGRLTTIIITKMTTPSGDVSRVAAEQILAAAVKKSEELSVKMNIAVMDNGANLVGFLRMDGAWLGSADIAMKKSQDCSFLPDEHRDYWDTVSARRRPFQHRALQPGAHHLSWRYSSLWL